VYHDEVRLLVLAIVAACSNEPSRLDGLTARGGGTPTIAHDAAQPDEADRDLRRRLREATARPLDGTPIALDARVLGRAARPFGPLTAVRPRMTRAELLAAVPGAQADGTVMWVPTGIDGVTVEMSFDRGDRLGEIIYRMPLAVRPVLIEAWGPLVPQAETWFDRERGWRARMREDAIKREVAVVLSGFTPFADVIGRGPDGLAEPTALLGASLRELRDRFGARLVDASTTHGFVELVMPRATDICAAPTELGLELDRVGVVKRVMLMQCYDDVDVNRREALAIMERAWGPAVPARTRDDRLVFAWTLPDRRIEAHQVPHADHWLWEITILDATRK
jgi:hypothetical protein